MSDYNVNEDLILRDLVESDHPYHSANYNYYSNEATVEHDSLKAFLDEFEDADIDMNLVFRWDVKDTSPEDSDEEDITIYVYLLQQRKGIYSPQIIEDFEKDQLPRFRKYLQKHYKRLQEIWSPISEGELRELDIV